MIRTTYQVQLFLPKYSCSRLRVESKKMLYVLQTHTQTWFQGAGFPNVLQPQSLVHLWPYLTVRLENTIDPAWLFIGHEKITFIVNVLIYNVLFLFPSTVVSGLEVRNKFSAISIFVHGAFFAVMHSFTFVYVCSSTFALATPEFCSTRYSERWHHWWSAFNFRDSPRASIWLSHPFLQIVAEK